MVTPRIALASSAFAAACLLAGCQCDPGQPEIVYDGMEDVCGPLPCLWVLEEGSAASTTTFHAGEHGMTIDAGARVTRPLAEVPLALENAAPAVLLLASCDPGASVRIRLEARESATPVELVGETATGVGAGETVIGSMLVTLSAAGVTAPTTLLLNRWILEIVGAGSCTVDELRILDGSDIECLG